MALMFCGLGFRIMQSRLRRVVYLCAYFWGLLSSTPLWMLHWGGVSQDDKDTTDRIGCCEVVV